MPEPSYRQLSQEHPHAFAIGIHDVRTGPSRADELGESVLLCADRGDIQAILHQAPEAQRGVIWVGGARGGFGKPGHGASARLADVLRRDRIASLRLRYRHPNVLPECALDIMAGIASLTHCRAQPVVLVGHSFGGAVVMTAGALHAHVAGVVALAPQTSGATLAGKLAPRPLLVVHGTADTRLPYSCGVQMYHWAQASKQLVLYEGAEHRLDEGADALDQLFMQWMPTTLRSTACMGGACGPVPLPAPVEPVDWPTKRLSLDGFGGGRVCRLLRRSLCPICLPRLTACSPSPKSWAMRA